MEDLFYKQAKEEVKGSYGRDVFCIIEKRESNIAKAFCIASGCDPDDINRDKSFVPCSSNTCKKLGVFLSECKKFHSMYMKLENPELKEHLK